MIIKNEGLSYIVYVFIMSTFHFPTSLFLLYTL